MKIKKMTTNRHKKTGNPKHVPLPFLEHLRELRRRIYFIVASVAVWGSAAYAIEHHIVSVLLRPANGERFIYTTPGGGIDFLFRICVYSGIILSLPVIVYNSLRFIEPLITKSSQRFILWGSAASGVLAAAGIIFGYYVGLPAALHFLLHQFTTVQIQPLVTIQSYLGFVIVYMVGSAMLFQLPLVLLFINRIKPLKPRRLFHYERWVILAAFVLAGLMNPSPNIISQLLIAGPFILMYQFGILLIALINRPQPVQAVIVPEPDISVDMILPRMPARRQPTPKLVADVVRRQPAGARQQPVQARQSSASRVYYTPRSSSRQRFMDFIPPARQNLSAEL